MDKQRQQEAYKNYVQQKTPVHSLPVNMARAFVTGGLICVIGQGILNFCKARGLEQDICGSWTSIILILLSVGLTLLGGLIPSKKAAKSDPVLALRTE